MSKDYTSEGNARDLLPLVLKYLRINRKYLLASILGLALAIMVISQILLLSGGTSSNIYADALDNGHVPVFKAETFGFHEGLRETNFSSISDDLYNVFENAVEDQGLSVQELRINWQYEFDLITDSVNPDFEGRVNLHFSSYGLTERMFDTLKMFPTFPDVEWRNNLSVLVVDDYVINEMGFPIETFTEPNLNFTSFQAEVNFTRTPDAVWVLTSDTYNFGWTNNIDYILRDLGNNILEPTEKIVPYYEDLGLPPDRHSVSGYINIKSLEGLEPEVAIQKINKINNQVFTFLSNTDIGGEYYFNTPAEWRIDSARFESAAIAGLLLIFSLPMLAVALYLVYFSLNLVELRKQNLVSIMKIRGISSGQLQFMLVVESILSSLLASIVGMVLSIPVAQYVLDQSKIYGLNSTVNIYFDWFWTVPVIGIILAIDLNIFSILSISSTTVEEGEESEEKKEPFWRRFYLDLIFSVIGVILWLVVRYVPLEREAYFIFLGLAAWSLPFLILGLPLLVSRYYSDFLTVLSDFLWVREGNLFALATRNMRNNKFSASKLAVLLMIGMMFSFVAIGVPNSFQQWSVDSTYYNTGADFRITGLNATNTTYLEPLNHPDLDGFTKYYESQLGVSATQYYQIRILAIDPGNFSDTAFWEDSYAESDLDDLMEDLSEDKILMEEQAMSVLQLEDGDNFVVNSQQLTLNQEIGTSFKYWPLLVDFIWSYDTFIETVHIVMNLDTYEEKFQPEIVNVLADAKDSANMTAIHEDLKDEYVPLGISNQQIANAEQRYYTFDNDPMTQLLYAIFDVLLVITVITSMIGVGYFSFTTLAERKREIGVFRAVGMVSRQIFLLLVVESIILVSTSILVGILAGSFIASNLFLLLGADFGGNIPPIELEYPPLITAGFVVVALILSILAAIIPARSTANKQTGSILRAE